MKKLLVLFLALVFAAIACCPNTSHAQTSQEKIIVNATDLTPEQYAKIKADQELTNLNQRIEKYGNWVGVGDEIGKAINQGLTSVVDVADKFGKTDVGKFTMYLIAWKVIGKDAVRIFIGLLIAIISTIFIFHYYRTTFTTYKIKTKGAWWQIWVPKEYQIVKPDSDWDGYYFVKWLTWAMLLASYGIVYAVMFA